MGSFCKQGKFKEFFNYFFFFFRALFKGFIQHLEECAMNAIESSGKLIGVVLMPTPAMVIL